MVHTIVDDSDFSEIRLLFLHSQTRHLVSVSVLLFGSCQLNQFNTNSEAAMLSTIAGRAKKYEVYDTFFLFAPYLLLWRKLRCRFVSGSKKTGSTLGKD